MTRWIQAKRRPTAEEQRAAKHAKALADCQQGKHHLTATFRPGEQLCTVCRMMLYCATCLKENNLAIAQGVRAYPFDCPQHRKVVV